MTKYVITYTALSFLTTVMNWSNLKKLLMSLQCLCLDRKPSDLKEIFKVWQPDEEKGIRHSDIKSKR